MNSTKRGWLKNYIDLRHGLLQNLKSPLFQTSHPDHTLYRAVQPTGLMYGQTVSVEKESLLPANRKVQTKIALAESLISSSILSQDKPIDSAEAFDVAVEKAIEDIGSFYNNVFPEIATPSKTLFGRKRTAYEMAESVLEKRVQLTGEIQGNFWTNFFQRSMLFLDVFIFGQWIHTNADKIVTDFFRYERDELRFSIVKVISAAAHANREVAYQEKKLFEFFIYSTNLPPAKRKEAMAIFEQGIAIDDINLPADNSWILKKFFLEIAILTLWVDKRLEQQELDFIKCFTHYLNFSEQELEHSLMAIEGFVLEHWQEIEYLQRNQTINRYVINIFSVFHFLPAGTRTNF